MTHASRCAVIAELYVPMEVSSDEALTLWNDDSIQESMRTMAERVRSMLAVQGAVTFGYGNNMKDQGPRRVHAT